MLPVGLFASPWIEISVMLSGATGNKVGLFASPWIEIRIHLKDFCKLTSGSLRARGLKSDELDKAIETLGRALCEPVD